MTDVGLLHVSLSLTDPTISCVVVLYSQGHISCKHKGADRLRLRPLADNRDAHCSRRRACCIVAVLKERKGQVRESKRRVR